MPEAALQLDGSPELAAIVLRLHRWFADATFSSGEVAAVALSVDPPSSDTVPIESYLRNYVAALERCGYLEGDGDAWRLAGRAREFVARQDRTIEREIELIEVNLNSLPEATELPAEVEREADLHQVTRAFLEEALGEASLPAELMETIVRTYERSGRLTMSEDGGSYRIRFTS